MNFNNLARTALAMASVIALSGCDEWQTDEKLMQGIWQEALITTGLDTDIPNPPMPKVEFLDRADPKANGRFYFRDWKAEIYLGSLYKTAWAERNSGHSFSIKEGEALVYDTVAHEMLHAALHLKGVPGKLQHRQMKEGGHLLRLIGYINDYLQINSEFPSHPNGYHEELMMRSLDAGIENDSQ